MRLFVLLLALFLWPLSASAGTAPPGQTEIDSSKVLRGDFYQEHQFPGTKSAMHYFGKFVVAPAHGLIWNMMKPLPTIIIVTPSGVAQSFAGVAMKLPTVHTRQLYTMVSSALAGDWSKLERDFIIAQTVNGDQWTLQLSPRDKNKPTVPYSKINVTGRNFVETIYLGKDDGTYDMFRFSNPVLSDATLAPQEAANFNMAAR